MMTIERAGWHQAEGMADSSATSALLAQPWTRAHAAWIAHGDYSSCSEDSSPTGRAWPTRWTAGLNPSESTYCKKCSRTDICEALWPSCWTSVQRTFAASRRCGTRLLSKDSPTGMSYSSPLTTEVRNSQNQDRARVKL